MEELLKRLTNAHELLTENHLLTNADAREFGKLMLEAKEAISNKALPGFKDEENL